MKTNYSYFARPLLKIALPIMLGNIVAQIQMLIDRAFLGHFDSLYMSALSNASTPLWTTMSFVFSVTMGASIIISQKVGAGDKDKTEEVAASLMKWNNIVPVLLFLFWFFFAEPVLKLMDVDKDMIPMCLDYIRWFSPIFLIVGLEASSMVIMQTSNNTRPLAIFGIVRSLLNVLLDWLLIFGNWGFPRLGIKGAAIATTIAEYIGFVYTWCIFMTSKQLPTRPRTKIVFLAKIRPYWESFKLGLNAALEDFAWNFGNLIMIVILNKIDKNAAGIYSTVFAVGLLITVIVASFGQANMTLSGEAVGAKDQNRYRSTNKVAMLICEGIIFVLSVVCLVIPTPILSLFSDDMEFVKNCAPFMLLMCLNLISKTGNIVIGYGIRATGDTRWMFFTQIFGTFFVVGSACLFVFVFKLGIQGVFLAVLADEFVRFIFNYLHYRKLAKKI